MHYILVNGKKINADTYSISPFDRGITLGHGLFETMLITQGMCPLISYHFSRLLQGAELIGVKIPFSLDNLQNMISELLSENKLLHCEVVVRLTVTDGIAARGILSDGKQDSTYILTGSPLPKNAKPSLSATIVNTRRNEQSLSSKVKSISYLDNILAKKEAVSRGFDEAFLLNSKSKLSEGAISNVFLIKDKKIYSPRLEDGALPGIIRHLIVNKLPEIEVIECPISRSFLFEADELFISNTVMGVKPIHQLGDKIFSKDFYYTTLIASSLNKFISSNYF